MRAGIFEGAKGAMTRRLQARAMLTSALVGAQAGLTGIPRRFIDGLEEREELLRLAGALAEDVDQ